MPDLPKLTDRIVSKPEMSGLDTKGGIAASVLSWIVEGHESGETMGTAIAVAAVVMSLLVLNSWRIQLRDWRAERRRKESGQSGPGGEHQSEKAGIRGGRRMYGQSA